MSYGRLYCNAQLYYTNYPKAGKQTTNPYDMLLWKKIECALFLSKNCGWCNLLCIFSALKTWTVMFKRLIRSEWFLTFFSA